MPIPIPAIMLPDTVVIYPRILGTDADGAQTISEGTGVTYAARVEPANRGSRAETQGTILSSADYNVILGIDPSVLFADVRIDWTARGGVPLGTVARLVSVDRQQDPSGFDPITFWLVGVRRRS